MVNGRHAVRHANACVIYTDNTGYKSCRPMDESVIRRFSFIITSNTLEKDEVLERIRANTGYGNGDVLEKIYQIWTAIRSYCKKNDITEGEISITEIENLVALIKLEGLSDLKELLLETVISKASANPDVCEEIWENCAKLETDRLFA